MTAKADVAVGPLEEIPDPGCREFEIGGGEWPIAGFVVRQGRQVFAYRNYCMHAGHRLNFKPHSFLTRDGENIICASHGAVYDIPTGTCTGGPCVGAQLRALEAEVRDGIVFVSAAAVA